MEADIVECGSSELSILEEIEAAPRNDFNLPLDLAEEESFASNDVTHESSIFTENMGITPRRKRGRPRRGEGRKVVSGEPRLNPDRAARHRLSAASMSTERDELEPSTSTENITVQRRVHRRRGIINRHRHSPIKSKGRPRRDEIKKPICVVKPMQQTGNENTPRVCGWSGCSHTANSVRTLKTHVEREHLNQLSQFVCRWDSCGRVAPFKALYMLSLHLRSHIGERPFECRICGKTYTRQENLRTHTRMHQNERPFKCSVCHKGFTSSSDKAKHQKRTHNTVKSYKCPLAQCPKKYSDPSSLRKHIIKVHGADYYSQAKRNKQQNGPGNDYGVINPIAVQDLSDQPSTSRAAEAL